MLLQRRHTGYGMQLQPTTGGVVVLSVAVGGAAAAAGVVVGDMVQR